MKPELPGPVATRHYFDRDFGRAAVKLLPSEYYVTSQPTVMLTVLGSCVAACLHDPYAGVAGMNHFMLPDEAPSGPDHPDAMRYGTHAMDTLVRELVRAGARRERLQAKVFGGAAVLPNMPFLNVGDRNAEFVLRYLQQERIDLYAQDLGGRHARRVGFLGDTGKAVVRKLRAPQDLEQVQSQEADLLRKVVAPRAWAGVA
ncbi:MAG: chemoreceptor glutamine deamidase CheD [Ramlibacter sp.]